LILVRFSILHVPVGLEYEGTMYLRHNVS